MKFRPEPPAPPIRLSDQPPLLTVNGRFVGRLLPEPRPVKKSLLVKAWKILQRTLRNNG